MDFDHRSILSGTATGPVAVAARAGLRAASWLYGIGARTRRYQYDSGRKPVHHADVPVISVGNLTTGGTGKTPIVCDLCRRLREMNRRVAIISRGYGAGETGINDEAMELAECLPDVPHVQHPDRVEAAQIAVDELGAEVLVMDDGFQHRRLHRDLDLVVIDATCPFGLDAMLPRGYLREPVSGLRRADAVMLTRTDQVDASELNQIRQRVERYIGDRAIIETVHHPAWIGFEDGHQEPIDSLRGRPVGLISAIGNPAAFEQTVLDCGGVVVGHRKFPDHDAFDRETRNDLRQWVHSLAGLREEQVSPKLLLLCTHKDAVKLGTDQIGGVLLGSLRIELAYRSGQDRVPSLLANLNFGIGRSSER